MLPITANHASSTRSEVDQDGPILAWSCHPVKRRPLVSVAVTLGICLFAVLVFLATLSRFFTVLSLVVLFTSLAKFYFPTSYRLTSKSVTVKSLTHSITKEFSLYRSCYADKNGILLSPFVGPSRLENFRGLYLMFNNNAAEVTAFVKERIAASRDQSASIEENPEGTA